MRAFETVHAEPRDSFESPSFRVNFWDRTAPDHAWNLEAFVLTDVEGITEVLRWAGENARGRRFEVFVEVDEEQVGQFESPRTAALVRLLGSNPNAGESVEIGPFKKS